MSSTANQPSTAPRASVSGSTFSVSTPKDKSPSRPSTASSTPNDTLNRARSVRTTPGPSAAAAARTSARKPGARDNTKDEEQKAETNSLIEDLKDQLRKTETASEDYQKQLVILQSRLDEALGEQNRLEDSSARHIETIASLQAELQDVQRSRNDEQMKLEKEQATSLNEREAASTREGELNDIISRLKESLTQREPKKGMAVDSSLSRAASFRGRSSPNPEGSPVLVRRDSSQNNSQLLLQKDKVIEDLRLELAEASLKVMEVDRAGGGRMQDLERQLLDVRMSNAKLMEDNESYQYLLQERTLSGEIAHRFAPATPSDHANLSRSPSRDPGSGTLADELETVGEEDESSGGNKRLEKELSAQKEQNKALTLYINRIIGRLLATDNFEQLFENGTITGDNNPLSTAAKTKVQTDKDLPNPPTLEDESVKENNAGASLLSRAGSIFRPRPRSYQPPQGQAATEGGARQSIDQGSEDMSAFTSKPLPIPVDDPSLAPRVPLQRGSSVRQNNSRGHRRTASEMSASTVSNSFYTNRIPSGGPMSPPLLSSHHSSFTGQSPPHTAMGMPFETPRGTIEPANIELGETRRSNSRAASDSGYGESIDNPSSPPRSAAASSTEHGRSSGGAAIVSGGRQMRPLRLVQEKVEADEEKKRANRSSWMGWFNKGPQAPGPAGGLQARPPYEQPK